MSSSEEDNFSDDYEDWSNCVHKVLEQVHPGMELSEKGMVLVTSLLQNTFEKIAKEAG